MNKLIQEIVSPVEPSFYKEIYGYFDWQEIYQHICHKYPTGTVVEIGTWLGKSTCYFAELIKGNNYNTRFYTIDTFLGEVNAVDQQNIVKENGGSVYKRFLLNMKEAGVLNFVTPLQLTSESASELFNDNSLDAVFLDAEHLEDDVRHDLELWYPKVKSGGLLAGHDYHPAQNNSVSIAVNKFFKGKEIYHIGNSFLHDKQ